MSDQRDVVGLIGLGQMGGAMCRTLLRFGWRVIAWEISPSALAAAVADGAEPADSPADVAARTQIMLTSLPDAGAVREVALGAGDIVTGECSWHLLVDASTTS